MATNTTGTLSAEIKTFYDRTLLQRALPRLVHAQFGQQRTLRRANGKTIEFRRFDSLPPATTPLTEGTPPAGQSLSVTALTAAIAQYGDVVYGTDLLDLTAIDPILTETSELLGEQAGDTIDQVVRDVLVTGTNVQYANGRASRTAIVAGDVLTVAEIKKAVRTLKRVNARPVAGGDFIGIVHPDAAYDLMNDTEWVSANQYAGSQRIFAGEIGRIHGVRFIETTNAKVWPGAGGGTPPVDVYATLILGADAYGVINLEGQNLQTIFKPVGSGGTADPLDQKWSMGWKAAFAAKILNDNFLVRIEHTVS